MMKQGFSFYVLTDTHYFSPSLMTPGKAFDDRQAGDQVLLLESGPIIDAAFAKIAADHTADTVLIHGDLINNGEEVNHIVLREKLETLRAAGKRVFLTTATHDFATGAGMDNGFTPKKFAGDSTEPVAGMDRGALRSFYHAYGFDQAYSVHEPSMSYAVRLREDICLLALNDDGNGRSFCGYSADCVAWILDRAQEARAQGSLVLAMTHHPVIPPVPVYPMMSERDMLGNYEQMQELFADAGISFVFTGHTHMHDISMVESDKGNPLYDIATGALVGYPCPMRKVTVTQDSLQITTEHPDTFEYQGKVYDTLAYTREKTDALVASALRAAGEDHAQLAVIADGFGVPQEAIFQNAGVVTLIGNILRESTVGELSAMMGSQADIAGIEDMPIQALLQRIFRDLFGGDESITPDTPEYRAVMGIAQQLGPTAEKFGFSLGDAAPMLAFLPNLLSGILYDAPPSDAQAVLPIVPLQA